MYATGTFAIGTGADFYGYIHNVSVSAGTTQDSGFSVTMVGEVSLAVAQIFGEAFSAEVILGAPVILSDVAATLIANTTLTPQVSLDFV